MDDLDVLTCGEVYDIFTEHNNDSYDYDEIATQEDIDAF